MWAGRADGNRQWRTMEEREPPHKDNNKFLLNQHLAEVITVAQTVIQFKGRVYDIHQLQTFFKVRINTK